MRRAIGGTHHRFDWSQILGVNACSGSLRPGPARTRPMTDETLMTRFGFASTADEVLVDVDLSVKRAVVSGAASGIGVETARALASVGAAVVLAVRRPQAAEPVAAGITASTGNKAVTVQRLDLADQTSVTGFVDGWEGPLHILVNNAGPLETVLDGAGLGQVVACLPGGVPVRDGGDLVADGDGLTEGADVRGRVEEQGAARRRLAGEGAS